MTAPTRVLVVDDSAAVGNALIHMLDRVEDFHVVGLAVDGIGAIEACRADPPDVVLMDLRMPRMDGLEAARIIRAELPRTAVVMHSAYSDAELVREGTRATAQAFVLKGSSPRDVVETMRRAARAVRRDPR